MKTRHVVAVGLGCLSLACASSKSEQHGDAHGGAPHWTYEGEAGPEKWGDLAADFAMCKTGQAQSPVDVKGAASADAPEPGMEHAPAKLDVVNNGHTVQFSVDGKETLVVDGVTYSLAQFHFHHPSEHALNGTRYPLEVHLVHKSADGKLAVVGVMFQEGAEGPLADLFKELPKPGEHHAVTAQVDPTSLLPAEHSFYRYAGSLTTPPCSEGVTWMVMKTPQTATTAEIAAFEGLFKANARPLQDLHGRTVTGHGSVTP